jgi:CDGSH-type Zn-finger protein
MNFSFISLEPTLIVRPSIGYIPRQELYLPNQEPSSCRIQSLPRKALIPLPSRQGRPTFGALADGSHQGTGFTPVKYEAADSKTVYFCGCKHTADPPMCDGGHAKL